MIIKEEIILQLKELAETWIQGCGEDDCPEELKEQHIAREEAYKDAGLQVMELLNKLQE